MIVNERWKIREQLYTSNINDYLDDFQLPRTGSDFRVNGKRAGEAGKSIINILENAARSAPNKQIRLKIKGSLGNYVLFASIENGTSLASGESINGLMFYTKQDDPSFYPFVGSTTLYNTLKLEVGNISSIDIEQL